MNASNEAPIALVGIRSELGYLRDHVDVSDDALHPWGRFTQLVMYNEDLEQAPRLVQAALTLRQGARSPALLLRAAHFRQGQRQAMTALAALLDACLPMLANQAPGIWSDA